MFNISRKTAIIWCTAIGAFIAAFNPANLPFIFTALAFMGNTAPALAGVVLGRYILKEMGIVVTDNSTVAWAGWILGSTAAFLLGGIWSIPIGLVVGFGVWWMGTKFVTRSEV